MNALKNILLTTLDASRQIVPELLGWTNPENSSFLMFPAKAPFHD
jgi:hypothetical protein